MEKRGEIRIPKCRPVHTHDRDRSLERITRLQSVCSALSEALTPEDVAEVVVSQAISAVGASGTAIGLTEVDQNRASIMRAFGAAREVFGGSDRSFAIDPRSPIAEVIITGRPVWFESLGAWFERHPELARTVSDAGASAAVILPLELPRDIGARRIGFVAFFFREPRAFLDGERSFISAVANNTARALHRASLYKTQRDARSRAEAAERRLGFLRDASRELAFTGSGGEVNLASLFVPAFAEWCFVDLPGERVEATFADPSGAELAAASRAAGPDKEERALLERAVSSRSAVLAGELCVEESSLFHRTGARSVIVAPLVAGDKVIATFELISTAVRRYDEDDVAIVADLMQRASVLVEQARALREARANNDAKDEFLATLSHELRTPLNAILGWARLLRAGHLEEERHQRALATIETNAKAQARLIEDLLDMSRIITGKLRLELAQVRLREIVESAVEAIRPAAQAKDIELEVTLDEQVPPIAADVNRLHQVVWNLLSNAVKFTPRRGHVSVQLRYEADRLELTIADDGIGISGDFLPCLFDRFRQADACARRKLGGLGLGLAIVRHLVEIHGGKVTAESEGEGCGAKFTVTLPAQRVENMRFEPTPPRGLESPALRGIRVLLVDDEADARELLSAVLEQCGASVIAVSSAQEAMCSLETAVPDILLSDISMPGTDGYTLIRRVRALDPERGGRIPAAALTAYARAEDRTRALLAGFQSHVPKPIDAIELAAVVANLTGRMGCTNSLS